MTLCFFFSETDGEIHKTSVQRGGQTQSLGAPPFARWQPKGKGPAKDKFTADAHHPTRSRSKRKSNIENRDPDTNILMIKFGALSVPCKVHTGDPVICSNDQCAAILNYHSKITKETGSGGEGNVRELCDRSYKLTDALYTGMGL